MSSHAGESAYTSAHWQHSKRSEPLDPESLRKDQDLPDSVTERLLEQVANDNLYKFKDIIKSFTLFRPGNEKQKASPLDGKIDEFKILLEIVKFERADFLRDIHTSQYFSIT